MSVGRDRSCEGKACVLGSQRRRLRCRGDGHTDFRTAPDNFPQATDVRAEVRFLEMRRAYWLWLIDCQLPRALRRALEAFDILQEAHLALLEGTAAPTRQTGESLEIWFEKVIENKIKTEARRHTRRQILLRLKALAREDMVRSASTSRQETLEPLSSALEPPDQLLSKEDSDRILAAVDLLPSDLRIVFTLRHLKDYSIQDIALALDVTADLVSSRLWHAKRFLQEWLATKQTPN